MDQPKVIMPALASAIEGGDFDIANQVANILLNDLAWLIHTTNLCGHEECLQNRVEDVCYTLREYVEEQKGKPQRMAVERAREIAESALARALRR